MLSQIISEIFLQKEVNFHKGLNIIAGDDSASNSIGKSTMLMIVDFVFGGDDYIIKNHDVVEHLGHHEFKFTFVFNDKKYYYLRRTNEYMVISKCNKNFDVYDTISIKEYRKWLQKMYECELESLSFRDIVGRYFRIYGKENLNERKPIQYFEKEKSEDSILSLIKLFDKYALLKVHEQNLQELQERKKVLISAAKRSFIPSVTTQRAYKDNISKIEKLDFEIEGLKSEISTNSLDIEAMISKEILILRKEKSDLKLKLSRYESRLIRTQQNISAQYSKSSPELRMFCEYFPDFDVDKINEIETFHNKMSVVLRKELAVAEKELKDKINLLNDRIDDINKQIDDKLKVKDSAKIYIDEIIELVDKKKHLIAENDYYDNQKQLGENISEIKSTLDELRVNCVNDICNSINIHMDKLNKQIYNDERIAPTFNIIAPKYTFRTPGDTGTGTAFASLISFDIALLELTCLPAIAHDLPLLKNIENVALENILSIYYSFEKQIFIAIDKANSYTTITQEIIKKCKVLSLSKDKLLFTKNWKNK